MLGDLRRYLDENTLNSDTLINAAVGELEKLTVL
jgi:hypothetical protein